MEVVYQIGTAAYTTQNITPREIEILDLMAQGEQHKNIASILNIAELTVQTHVKKIYRKLGVHNKIEALNKIKWLTASPFTAETNF